MATLTGKKALIACVLLTAGCTGSPPKLSAQLEKCIAPSKSMEIFGPPMTISEIENISLNDVEKNPRVPQVAFGEANGEWADFKEALPRSAELYRYRFVSKKAASGGYVATHERCIIRLFPTWVE